jgi:hypothetical protein
MSFFDWEDEQSDLAPPPAPVGPPRFDPEQGDISRGWDTAFGQEIPTFKGLAGLIGATGEQFFGKGGYSSDLKDWGYRGFRSGMDDLKPLKRDYDDITVAYQRATQGDIGAMVDWFQMAIGYGAAEIVKTVGYGLAGAAAGSTIAPGPGTLAGLGAGAASRGVVQKWVADKLEDVIEKQVASGVSREAAEIAAPKIVGQNIRMASAAAVVGSTNIGLAGGNIYGEGVEEAQEKGEDIDAIDLARMWGSAVVSGGIDTLADRFGLSAALGKVTSTGGRLARMAKGGVATAGVEGVTEGIQTVVERFGAGKEATGDEAVNEIINSVAMGAVAGGMVGTAGGIRTPAQTVKNVMDPEKSLDESIQAAGEELDALLGGKDDFDPQAPIDPTVDDSGSLDDTVIEAIRKDVEARGAEATAQLDESNRAILAQLRTLTPEDVSRSAAEINEAVQTDILTQREVQAQTEQSNAAARPGDAGVDVEQAAPAAVLEPAAELPDRPVGPGAGPAADSAVDLASGDRGGVRVGSGTDAAGGVRPADGAGAVTTALAARPGTQPTAAPAPVTAQSLPSVGSENKSAVPVDKKATADTIPSRWNALSTEEQASALAGTGIVPARFQNLPGRGKAIATRAVTTATAPTTGVQRVQGALDFEAKVLGKPAADQVTEVGVDTLPDTRTELPDGRSTLSKREARMVQRFARIFGKGVVFYRGTRSEGMILPNDTGTIYINADTKSAHHLVVAGHELAHAMRRDAPDLYAGLRNLVKRQIKAGGLKAFTQSYYKGETSAQIEKRLEDKQEIDKLMEEFISDLVGNRVSELGTARWMLQQAAGNRDPGIIQRIAQFISDFIDTLLAKTDFRKFATDDMVKDLKAVRQEARAALANYARREAVRETPRAQVRDAIAAMKARKKPKPEADVDQAMPVRTPPKRNLPMRTEPPLRSDKDETPQKKSLEESAKYLRDRVVTGVEYGQMLARRHEWKFNVGDTFMSTTTGKAYEITGRTFSRVGKVKDNNWQAVYSYQSGDPEGDGDWERGTMQESKLLASKTMKSLNRPTDEGPLRSTERGPGNFYSRLSRGLKKLDRKPMSGNDWASWLKGNYAKLGATEAELEWSGVIEFLEGYGREKVDQDRVVTYLEDGGPKLEIVAMADDGGGISEAEIDDIATERFEARVREEEELVDDRVDRMMDDFDYPYYVERDEDTETGDFDEDGEPILQEQWVVFNTNDGRYFRNSREIFDSESEAESRAQDLNNEAYNSERDSALEQAYDDIRDELDFSQFRDEVIEEFGPSNPTEYSMWTVKAPGKDRALPGGSNYTEMLVRLPSDAADPSGRKIDFRQSHWNESNVLVHVRFDERLDTDGNKVMFLHEIQSDWGQKGRKRGFIAKPDPALTQRIEQAKKDYKAATGYPDRVAAQGRLRDLEIQAFASSRPAPPFNDTDTTYRNVRDWLWEAKASNGDTLLVFAQYERQAQSLVANWVGERSSPLDRGPFVTDTDSWVTLGLKSALGKAIQFGYDSVVIANGDQVADIYDMRKHVSRIELERDGKLVAVTKSGEVKPYKIYTADKLDEYVGKEMAADLIAQYREKGEALIEGDNMVGGEGHIAFYDTMVPKNARRLVKKIGGEVDTVLMGDDGVVQSSTPQMTLPGVAPQITGEGTRQLRIKITPEMRESAKGGLPLFSRERGEPDIQPTQQGDPDGLQERQGQEGQVAVDATPVSIKDFDEYGNPSLTKSATRAEALRELRTHEINLKKLLACLS